MAARGQHPAGDALAQAHQIRLHPLLLAGEQGAGAAKAGGHLVGYEQNAVFFADVPQAAHVSFGLHHDARRALHPGFHDQAAYLCPVFFQHGIKGIGTGQVAFRVFEAQGAPTAKGLGQAMHREQQGAVDLVEQVDAAHAHRADGVAVVGLAQGYEGLFLRMAYLLPILVGDLQRDLHGGGAALGVEGLV